jgi:hypothetical protein
MPVAAVCAAARVVLKPKTPGRDGSTHLVLSPLEFMQRRAAPVPCSSSRLRGSASSACARGVPAHRLIATLDRSHPH